VGLQKLYRLNVGLLERLLMVFMVLQQLELLLFQQEKQRQLVLVLEQMKWQLQVESQQIWQRHLHLQQE
jgi:hypothetical protein